MIYQSVGYDLSRPVAVTALSRSFGFAAHSATAATPYSTLIHPLGAGGNVPPDLLVGQSVKSVSTMQKRNSHRMVTVLFGCGEGI